MGQKSGDSAKSKQSHMVANELSAMLDSNLLLKSITIKIKKSFCKKNNARKHMHDMENFQCKKMKFSIMQRYHLVSLNTSFRWVLSCNLLEAETHRLTQLS